VLALDIISQVRERLGDIKKQRWTDKRMLNIVSQGQQDICKVTHYLRRVIYLPLQDGTTKYILPKDCININLMEHKGTIVPMYARNDKVFVPTDNNFVAYKSNLNISSIEFSSGLPDITKKLSYTADSYELTSVEIAPLYGVISYSETEPDRLELEADPLYGVATDVTLDYTRDKPSHFGEITEVTYTPEEVNAGFVLPEYGVSVVAGFDVVPRNPKYGYITEVEGHTVSGIYGLASSGAVEDETVKIYYVALPDKVTTMLSALIIPEVWEDLLMRYVVGTALQDDNDANNIQRGEVELQKYTTQLMKLKDLSTKDFATNSKEKFTTEFRSI